MKKKMMVCLIGFTLILLSAKNIFACTNFIVKALDGTVVNGRSMEFAVDLESELIVHPRGEMLASSAPSGEKGLKWTAKFGFVGANAFHLNAATDGLNEAGLSVGFLWFPGTEYQKVKPEYVSKAIEIMDLGNWILGNFKTVEEVKIALEKVKVWGKVVPQLGIVPPLHFTVHDASGKSLVVEYVDGEPKIYDNPFGVLTNTPDFPWMITNVKNYVNLTPLNSNPIRIGGVTFNATGQGSGFLGLPGDWTPPSRFIRAFAFTSAVTTATNADEAVNLVQHILNTVDIPKGVVREKKEDESIVDDYTQWIVIKDLKNKIFYFRTYGDLRMRAVDLKKLNLNAGGKFTPMAMKGKGWGIVDVTNQIKK